MKKDEFETKDIYQAAFLYARRLKLLRLEREGSSYWFVFENMKEAEALSNSYWGRDADVNAKAYSDAIRSLKDMIFSRKD